MNWEKELDEYIESDEHSYQCASHSEGQSCCLEKAWIRNLIEKVASEGYEKTMKAETGLYNTVLDMAVRTHHEMLSEHGHKLCNCFREKFALRLNDYMECKEREEKEAFQQADIDEIKRAIRDVMEDHM